MYYHVWCKLIINNQYTLTCKVGSFRASMGLEHVYYGPVFFTVVAANWPDWVCPCKNKTRYFKRMSQLRFELNYARFEYSTKNEHVHSFLLSNGVVANRDVVYRRCLGHYVTSDVIVHVYSNITDSCGNDNTCRNWRFSWTQNYQLSCIGQNNVCGTAWPCQLLYLNVDVRHAAFRRIAGQFTGDNCRCYVVFYKIWVVFIFPWNSSWTLPHNLNGIITLKVYAFSFSYFKLLTFKHLRWWQ